MRGCIQTLTPQKGAGTIVGPDGRAYRFSQDGMIFWMHYERLRIGTCVRFDRDSTRDAINVEIDLPQSAQGR